MPSVLYWWNPMVGWVRRRLHEAEDLCCGDWVEWAFPERNKDYALHVRVLDDHGKPAVGAWVEPGPGWAASTRDLLT